MKILYNEHLTETDKIIANVILEKKQCIEFLTVSTIAKAAYVAPSTVIKYVKKIGYDNWGDLKADIIKQQQSELHQYSNLQHKISYLLENLAANPKKFTSLMAAIEHAEYIILYGVDSSVGVLTYLAPRLKQVTNKPVLLHTEIDFIDIEINNNANNLIIFVSPCLSEPQIITRLEMAKQQKTVTWTITETLPINDNYQNIITLTNEPCTTYSCNYLCNRTLYFVYFELLIDNLKLEQGLEITYK